MIDYLFHTFHTKIRRANCNASWKARSQIYSVLECCLRADVDKHYNGVYISLMRGKSVLTNVGDQDQSSGLA
jgi:hypothetical protein